MAEGRAAGPGSAGGPPAARAGTSPQPGSRSSNQLPDHLSSQACSWRLRETTLRLSIRETMLSSRSVAVNRVPRGTHMYGVASAPWPSVPY